jgi:hypothetical protein
MTDQLDKRDDRIRQKAFELWEAEGRPEGQQNAHWDKATELVAIEDNQADAARMTLDPEKRGQSGEPIEALKGTVAFPATTNQGEQEFSALRRSA